MIKKYEIVKLNHFLRKTRKKHAIASSLYRRGRDTCTFLEQTADVLQIWSLRSIVGSIVRVISFGYGQQGRRSY